jgi:hypothetical protein
MAFARCRFLDTTIFAPVVYKTDAKEVVMRRSLTVLTLAVYLFFSSTGCVVITTGEASWEAYVGLRTRQHGEKLAKVEIKSSVVDKIVGSLTDGEISETE